MINDRKNKRCQVTDVAIPEDSRGERRKMKMWGMRTKVVPGVVGALG